MRILRLVDDGDFAVEFHPFITVVAGLSGDRRERIVEAFARAASGHTADLRGLIEVHGVVLDLDDRALDLLELEESEVETSVLAEDLPGNASSGVGRQVRAAERRLEELEQPRRDRLVALHEAEEALEAAATAEAPARDTVDVHGDGADLASVEEERAALLQRIAELQDERDRLFVALDPGAGVALDEAEATLAAIERSAIEVEATVAGPGDTASSDRPVASPGRPDVGPELSEQERAEQIEELQTSLSLHRLYHPEPVREALDDLRAAQNSEMVPSTEALSLADRLGDLDRAITELGANEAPEPAAADMERADQQVERARLALAELERAAASEAGGDDDIAQLEAAHAAVERARDALDGRFGRAKAQQRLDDALAAEDELLERLGLHSYTDFLTRGGAVAPAAGASTEFELARAAVDEAESAAEALRSRVDAALTEARLVEERRQARDEARRLLGAPELSDEALTTELLNVRVPTDPLGPVARLADVLETVGLPVAGLDLDGPELEAMAADWLAEYQHTESRILERIDALESPDGAVIIDVSADMVGELPPDDEDRGLDGTTSALAAVEAARDRVAAHEDAVEALAAAENGLAEAEAELATLDADSGPGSAGSSGETDAAVDDARAGVEEATLALERAQTEYDAAVEELAALRQTVSEMDDGPLPVGEIEWYLLARLAAQRQQSFVGSVPLVIAAALDGVSDDDGLLHLLDRLERMAGAVQIVHLTDDERIIGWADALDDDRAAVVRPVAARDGAG